jgi:acetyltransferase-like isoleucine patch superfamily enzyme/coenzyme F420-reducing hydrogenase beta subunit
MDAGGLVAGSRYGEDWKSAEHILAHNLDELLQVKGSKYFQSDTKRIYSEVKTALCEGKKVLFCGTPCQNAAIRNYLGKEYENLFCMDFICRSINSPKAFKAYIEELEVEYSSKVCEVHLKNKKGGWQSLASQVCFENGRESIRDRNEDWWVKGFIYNDLYTRESCYHCQYREFPRKSSDITIGDFWGIKNQSDRDMFKGISVVMINSAKGKVLFDNAKDDMVVQRHTLDEVIEGNSALLENPVRTVKQDQFFKLLQRNPFSICVKKCTKENVIKFMKRKIFRMVKSAITKTSHIWNILKDKKISVFSYIYYNYFCKNIIRCGGAKIIPCKGTVLELHPTARIYLKGRNLEICGNKLNKSKSETHIRMRKNSVWNCNNGGYLFYDTVLEVDENAVLDTGYFSANGGSVIMAHKHITLGEDVMMGRNIIVYDSDFHTLNNRYGVPSNPPKPVVIEDHVWLTTNVMVQKGVTIGKDSLIAAYTVVNKDIPEHSIVGGKSVGIVIGDEISWSRDTCPME